MGSISLLLHNVTLQPKTPHSQGHKQRPPQQLQDTKLD
jgi:hypothetical protein